MFNSSKSKLLFFGRSDSRSWVHVPHVEFNDSVIELGKHYKHLDNVIGQNCYMDRLQDCLSALNGKVNMVNSDFDHSDFDSLYQIFKTYCMPLYGSQLWVYDNIIIGTFNVTWRKDIRRLLSLPIATHYNLLPYNCYDIPPNLQLYKRVIYFINGLSKSTNVITSPCYLLVVNCSGSSISNALSILSSMWCVPRSYVCTINKNNSS